MKKLLFGLILLSSISCALNAQPVILNDEDETEDMELLIDKNEG